MLIISQDKKSIYNFNNMKSLDLVGNQIFVTDNTLADEGVRIGKYETKERAKEVLKEITKRKAMFELFRIAPTGGKEQTEMLEKFTQEKIIFDTYEMPEE